MNNYNIEIAGFLIPATLDNYLGSKDIVISIIVGTTCTIVANGIKNHFRKKITTQVKEYITTRSIDAVRMIGGVKKGEIFRDEIDCILPSLQIFIGLNILNVYILSHIKSNIGILISMASIIFQYNIYKSLRTNEVENYKNIFKNLDIELQQYIKKFKSKND